MGGYAQEGKNGLAFIRYLGACLVLAGAGVPYARAYAATQAEPAEQRMITRNVPPRPVPPLATAQVQGEDQHAKARPVTLSAQGLQADVKVADNQPCPANSLLLGKDENPTPGQTCRVATLEVTAPEHPAFIQTIGSLMAEDSGGLMDLHLSLYQLAPDAQKTILPQVVVSGYTGGAHCCQAAAIIEAAPQGQWRVVPLPAQNGGGEPIVQDVARDGTRQLIYTDERFDYAFASHAGSAMPVVLYQYQDGQLQNVTAQPRFAAYLRNQLAQDSAQWRKAGVTEVNGYLAAYVATSANIGELNAGWRYMMARYDNHSGFAETWCALDKSAWPQSKDGTSCPKQFVKIVPFPQSLAQSLVQWGYITSQQSAALGYDVEKIKQNQQQVISSTTKAWRTAH
ncbi:hypothetical protein AA11825_0202 [Acetobacter pomorum DSM 11825]|nr:hypothetical protein AA11825_0202 [Acetobacter pomorum DSM 11825]